MRFMKTPRKCGRIVKAVLPVAAGYEAVWMAGSGCRVPAQTNSPPDARNKSTAAVSAFPAQQGFAMLATRQPFNQGAREARHGQGSDAQQQGKEETEAGQEPEKGRRRALAVRLRQVAAEPLSRQEGLTARLRLAGGER